MILIYFLICTYACPFVCIVAHFTSVLCQMVLDAQTAHHCSSHTCKRAGTLSFLLFMALSPAESLGLMVITFFKYEKILLENEVNTEEIKAERQKRGRILQHCSLPQILSCLKPTNPLGHPFVSQ